MGNQMKNRDEVKSLEEAKARISATLKSERKAIPPVNVTPRKIKKKP